MNSQRKANGKAFVLHFSTELTNRGFKALKQMTKMNYLLLHRPEPALETYKELLGYTKVRSLVNIHCHAHRKNNVTRNYAEKSINSILDYVGGEGKVSLSCAVS